MGDFVFATHYLIILARRHLEKSLLAMGSRLADERLSNEHSLLRQLQMFRIATLILLAMINPREVISHPSFVILIEVISDKVDFDAPRYASWSNKEKDETQLAVLGTLKDPCVIVDKFGNVITWAIPTLFHGSLLASRG